MKDYQAAKEEDGTAAIVVMVDNEMTKMTRRGRRSFHQKPVRQQISVAKHRFTSNDYDDW
jgi:hypothetical protein